MTSPLQVFLSPRHGFSFTVKEVPVVRWTSSVHPLSTFDQNPVGQDGGLESLLGPRLAVTLWTSQNVKDPVGEDRDTEERTKKDLSAKVNGQGTLKSRDSVHHIPSNVTLSLFYEVKKVFPTDSSKTVGLES